MKFHFIVTSICTLIAARTMAEYKPYLGIWPLSTSGTNVSPSASVGDMTEIGNVPHMVSPVCFPTDKPSSGIFSAENYYSNPPLQAALTATAFLYEIDQYVDMSTISGYPALWTTDANGRGGPNCMSMSFYDFEGKYYLVFSNRGTFNRSVHDFKANTCYEIKTAYQGQQYKVWVNGALEISTYALGNGYWAGPSFSLGGLSFGGSPLTGFTRNFSVRQGLRVLTIGNSITSGDHTSTGDGWRYGFEKFSTTRGLGWLFVGDNSKGSDLTWPGHAALTGTDSPNMLNTLWPHLENSLPSPDSKCAVIYTLVEYNDMHHCVPPEITYSSVLNMISRTAAYSARFSPSQDRISQFFVTHWQPNEDSNTYAWATVTAACNDAIAAGYCNVHIIDLAAESSRIATTSIGHGNCGKTIYVPSDQAGHDALGEIIAQKVYDYYNSDPPLY